MGRKKTNDKFKKEVYGLEGDEYKTLEGYDGAHTHIKFRHSKCGEIIKMTPNQFLNGRRCNKCEPKTRRKPTKWTHEKYVESVLLEVGEEYTVIGKYEKTRKHITMKHNKCGNVWRVFPTQFLYEGTRCPVCVSQKRGISLRLTQEEFEQEVKEKLGEEYKVIGEYVTKSTQIEMLHTVCGTRWKTIPNSMVSNHTGCPECWNEIKGTILMKTHDEYTKEVYDILGDEYDILSRYRGSNKNIKVRHNKCGYIWEVEARQVIRNEGGCHKCKESLGERRIRRYIEGLRVSVKGEVQFKDLYYKNPLRYDFGVYDKEGMLKGLIEYDGKQHFEVIEFYGEQAYIDTKIRDDIKNKYADGKNIPLLRIPYTERDIIEEVVEEFLQEIGIHEEELN